MLYDKQTLVCKSVIQFIDIILDLYSPVPYDIRNEMRILQSTLLYGHNKQLQEYITTLKQRLQLRSKVKHEHQTLHDPATPKITLQKSATKIVKNPLSDSDKENKFYLNNIKINHSDSLKSKQNLFNATAHQLGKNRKISAVEYLNRDEDAIADTKGLIKDGSEFGKTPSRTLLKIVKRNRSSKQKHPLTERSLQQSTPKIFERLKSNIADILSIMNKNDIQLNLDPYNFQVE